MAYWLMVVIAKMDESSESLGGQGILYGVTDYYEKEISEMATEGSISEVVEVTKSKTNKKV